MKGTFNKALLLTLSAAFAAQAAQPAAQTVAPISAQSEVVAKPVVVLAQPKESALTEGLKTTAAAAGVLAAVEPNWFSRACSVTKSALVAVKDRAVSDCGNIKSLGLKAVEVVKQHPYIAGSISLVAVGAAGYGLYNHFRELTKEEKEAAAKEQESKPAAQPASWTDYAKTAGKAALAVVGGYGARVLYGAGYKKSAIGLAAATGLGLAACQYSSQIAAACGSTGCESTPVAQSAPAPVATRAPEVAPKTAQQALSGMSVGQTCRLANGVTIQKTNGSCAIL